MKLNNTTDWPDHFLRRMTAWCCRRLDLPVRYVKGARFGNSINAWGGRAYLVQHRIGARVGGDGHFPTLTRMRETSHHEPIVDRIEALVMVTAHELAHLEQWRRHTTTRRGRDGGGSESITDHAALTVLNEFRAGREVLLANWNAADEKPIKARPSVIEERAAKAEVALARWSKKLRLAQTKIRKLKARVRYYSRKQAAASSEGTP